jgi:hypothetical protein
MQKAILNPLVIYFYSVNKIKLCKVAIALELYNTYNHYNFQMAVLNQQLDRVLTYHKYKDNLTYHKSKTLIVLNICNLTYHVYQH